MQWSRCSISRGAVTVFNVYVRVSWCNRFHILLGPWSMTVLLFFIVCKLRFIRVPFYVMWRNRSSHQSFSFQEDIPRWIDTTRNTLRNLQFQKWIPIFRESCASLHEWPTIHYSQWAMLYIMCHALLYVVKTRTWRKPTCIAHFAAAVKDGLLQLVLWNRANWSAGLITSSWRVLQNQSRHTWTELLNTIREYRFVVIWYSLCSRKKCEYHTPLWKSNRNYFSTHIFYLLIL